MDDFTQEDDFFADDNYEYETGGAGTGTGSGSGKGAEKGGKSAFLCASCGNRDCYEDEVTGLSVCAACHTQSQTQILDGDVEFEDIQHKAAKSKKGTMIGIRRLAGGRTSRPRKDFLRHDRSKRLPTLTQCLDGMTCVIRACLREVRNLMNIDQPTYDKVEICVKKLWLNWLQQWSEGAAFYSKYHPEVRFDLRDRFLPKHTRTVLYRYLRLQAQQKVNGKRRRNAVPNLHKVPITKVLDLYNRYGPPEAALRILPNMYFIAAILLIPLSRLGVSSRKMSHWVFTGKLPILNAFDRCLSPRLQDELHLVACKFRSSQVPSPARLDSIVELLRASTGSTELPPKMNPPMLVAELVEDLNLGQVVLDNALALMGKNIPGALPFSITDPSKLQRYDHIVGLVVVACKLVPGWETWKFEHGKLSVPYNENNALNAESWITPHYLDFMENFIIPEEAKAPTPSYLEITNDDGIVSGEVPRTSKIAVGELNPAKKRKGRLVNEDVEDGRVQLKPTIGPYLVSRKKEAGIFRPHYAMLLECISNVAQVPPIRAHRAAINFDKAIKKKAEGTDTGLWSLIEGKNKKLSIRRRAKTESQNELDRFVNTSSIAEPVLSMGNGELGNYLFSATGEPNANESQFAEIIDDSDAVEQSQPLIVEI